MRSIDPYLLEKIKQQQQTIHNKANLKMSIEVARAKTTVTDSTYWTVETMRTKEGLGESSIAARRQRPYGGPDGLYNIYIDNGTVRTAIREHPDYKEKKWQNQFDIGMGKAVAIAFDGDWERYKKNWQLVTHEKPYLFWVDNSNKLWVQAWDDENTKIELATNVSKVKAIRGWKNINFLDRDHGLIAAYIKTNGKVYYRGYCTQEDGSVVWESEREVEEFTGTAVNINLFVTNDYRTGFIIEDSQSNIHMSITERNWAGMAIPHEVINANPYRIKLELTAIEYPKTHNIEYLKAYPYEINLDLLFGNTENEIVKATNIPDNNDDWGWIVEVEVKNPIAGITLENITATDVLKSTLIILDSITKASEFKIFVRASDVVENGFNNVLGDIKIEIKNIKNEAGYDYDNMIKTFTPTNLEPEDIPIPEVEAIWNE